MKNLLFLSFFTGALFSCKQDDSMKQKLIGKWQGVSWTVGGKDAGRNPKAVSFEFKDGYTYSTAYEDQGEKGTFRLSGDKLYTTADAGNKIEKMVKIANINADTFVMDMNRMGDAEQLTLIKKP
jgi:Lipocalin-like domain